MKVSHVLVPTDFSDDAARPYEWAVELGAKVTLLHVVEDFRVLPVGAPLAPPVVLPSVQEEVVASENKLAAIAEKLGGATVEHAVARGEDVARTIVDWAHSHGVDLIAVSTHGRSGFRRLILGSIAEAVLRHADMPVLCFPRNKR